MEQLQKGQMVYMETHDMFQGYPKGKRFSPGDVRMVDGPSHIRYGEVMGISEDGYAEIRAMGQIDGLTGEEKPFSSETAGREPDVFRIPASGFLACHTSKEACQSYCDARNEVQMHNWAAVKPLDPRKQDEMNGWIQAVSSRLERKDLSLSDDDLKFAEKAPEAAR